MTLCPIAFILGCKECPALKICPLKGIIGDHPQHEKKRTAKKGKTSAKAKKK